MAFIAAKCTQCGANIEVDDSKEAGICPHCGTAFVTEKAINNYTINISTSVFNEEMSMENIYLLARRAAENKNYDNAEKYYDMILLKDPNDWEANFGSVFYKSMQTSIENISEAAVDVFNNLETTFSLIQNISSRGEEISAVKDVYTLAFGMACLFYENSVNTYNEIDSKLKNQYYEGHIDRVTSCCALLYRLGDMIDNYYHKNNVVGSLACNAWKEGISKNTEFYNNLFGKTKKQHKKIMKKYVKKIKEYEPSYHRPRRFLFF